MVTKYDVIVIGAGPNGMVCSAYLAKAGLKVLLLERRNETGGGLDTEELTLSGFLHNPHAVYMMMTDYAPPYQDFKLEEMYNVRHVYPPLQFAMHFADGRCLCLYSDVDRSCNSIAQFSERDADTYRKVSAKFERYVQEFVAPATYYPPSPVLEAITKMQQTDIGRELLELSEQSPEQIIGELYENESVKTLMLFLACLWGLDHDVTGVGYLVPLYLNRATNYRLTVGGSHMMAQALNKIILENGGLTLNSQRIKRILVEDNTARGVEMEDGTVIEAERAVVSTLDTHQTFLKLVGEAQLNTDFVESIKAWMWEKHSLLTIHLALDTPPDFTAAGAEPEINQAFIHVLGYDSTADLIRHYQAINNGELLEDAGFYCSFPSIHDPTQAPPGRCTGLITQAAPYHIKEGAEKWGSIKFKEHLVERYLTTLERYAPNLKQKVLWQHVSTPYDIENKFPDMVEGSIKQGDYHPLQMGFMRPNEECSAHRSPVKGLYMGGSCTYPGGTVIFGAGYQAANAVAEDLGVKKWWPEPAIVTAARQKGLL